MWVYSMQSGLALCTIFFLIITLIGLVSFVSMISMELSSLKQIIMEASSHSPTAKSALQASPDARRAGVGRPAGLRAPEKAEGDRSTSGHGARAGPAMSAPRAIGAHLHFTNAWRMRGGDAPRERSGAHG